MIEGAKTGEFHLAVEVVPGASQAEKEYRRSGPVFGMAERVAAILHDDRAYELVAQFGPWEAGGLCGGERLQVDFTLVLLDALTAEVGEWVKEIPHSVPDCKRTVILGEGHGEATGWVFRRGDLGWQRVE